MILQLKKKKHEISCGSHLEKKLNREKKKERKIKQRRSCVQGCSLSHYKVGLPDINARLALLAWMGMQVDRGSW